MNKIAMGGLIPFLVMSTIYKSPPMFIIFILGCLFHGHPKSRALYILDTGTNTSLLLYGACQNRNVAYLVLFILTFYPINSIVFPTPPNKKLWENIRHVLFVQWVGLYAFCELKKNYPCKDYIFIC
jgi:hypothetical protein